MGLGFREPHTVVGDGQRRALARTGQFERDEPIGRDAWIGLCPPTDRVDRVLQQFTHEDLRPAIKVVRKDVNDPAEVELKPVFG